MQPRSITYLRDMLKAARIIQKYGTGRSEQDFLADNQMRDSIHWNLCIIGEALSQLRRFDENTASQIDAFVQIIGLRNQLIHGYSIINFDVTWNIVQEKLPPLVSQLKSLLDEEDSSDTTSPADS